MAVDVGKVMAVEVGKVLAVNVGKVVAVDVGKIVIAWASNNNKCLQVWSCQGRRGNDKLGFLITYQEAFHQGASSSSPAVSPAVSPAAYSAAAAEAVARRVLACFSFRRWDSSSILG